MTADGSANSSPASDPGAPVIDEIHVEPLLPPETAADAAPALRIMDRDKFFNLFASLFVVGGNMCAMSPPLFTPMQSLVRAPNLPGARPASDEIYALAEKFDWLHWLIEEDADIWKSMLVIGAFGAQLGANVAAEMRSRAETIEALERDQAARAEAEQQPPQATVQ